MGIEFEERQQFKVHIDEKLIHSGDLLGTMRLDGLDPVLMYFTGAKIGHSATALWIEGRLYGVEGQASWFWPNQGIQKNLFHTWMKWTEELDINVIHLPLSPEKRAQFNQTAAIEFFSKYEGRDFGYHNFMTSMIDSEDNFPVDIPAHFIPSIGVMIEDYF